MGLIKSLFKPIRQVLECLGTSMVEAGVKGPLLHFSVAAMCWLTTCGRRRVVLSKAQETFPTFKDACYVKPLPTLLVLILHTVLSTPPLMSALSAHEFLVGL